MSNTSSSDDERRVDIASIDKKKLLRADERRRRANDEFGDIEEYLSESDSPSGQRSDSEDSSSEESDVEEDENGELITPEIDAQIMKALSALRSKDKSIYDSKVNFFSDDVIQESQKSWKAKQEAARQASQGVVTLRDYQHKVMVEHGGVVDEDKEVKRSLTHVQEQEALKNEFKAALGGNASDSEDDEGEEDFLVKKEKTKDEIAKEDVDYRKFLLDSMGSDAKNKAALDSWTAFTTDRETAGSKVDEGQAFLMGYILNRGWVDKSAEKQSAEFEAKAIVDKEEDEQYTELTDNFESKYNFRFEEEGGAQIKSYPRTVEGSLRRKDERRKLARERAKERKAELKKDKAEDLKKLKNQKKKDILEKLKEIQGITGNKTVGFDALDLDGDFDPAKFDSKMDEIFGDSAQVDLEKPTWDDDIDIGDLVSDGEEQLASSSKKSKKAKKSKKSKQADSYDADNDFIMDADYLDGGADASVAHPTVVDSAKRDQLKDKVSEYMDKYYQLDFEDIVGNDLPTRFKYSKVKAVDYGLTPAEILLADDKYLNEYVSVKKIAPYRPDWKIDDDLAKYASKKRMIYVKKKAAGMRSEWEKEAKAQHGPSTSKRRAATSSDTKTKKAKKSKDAADVASIADSPASSTSKDRTKKKSKEMAPASAVDQDQDQDQDQAKSQNRRQRQKAKKAAAAAAAAAAASN
ncbi:Ribosome biogenesis protein Kri1 [Coemansia aciculifera]|uniref:Ribosome biogenesis protein Kri1 n=1 Tax=Coemansia aciculifera TaxID=417176 RepID=A0ACC1M5U5_9FUNG|nr:Ribosome biogenesis protein Kri1 [Coemansia aciculifera]